MRGNASDPSPHFGRKGPGAIGRGVGGAYAIGVAERPSPEAGSNLCIVIIRRPRLLHLVVGQLHANNHGGEGNLERGSEEDQRRCISGSHRAFSSIRLSSLLFAADSTA